MTFFLLILLGIIFSNLPRSPVCNVLHSKRHLVHYNIPNCNNEVIKHFAAAKERSIDFSYKNHTSEFFFNLMVHHCGTDLHGDP
jgi:predicted RNA-binding Zn-ribbon protein involved in translation (DUF1610 family)